MRINKKTLKFTVPSNQQNTTQEAKKQENMTQVEEIYQNQFRTEREVKISGQGH